MYLDLPEVPPCQLSAINSEALMIANTYPDGRYTSSLHHPPPALVRIGIPGPSVLPDLPELSRSRFYARDIEYRIQLRPSSSPGIMVLRIRLARFGNKHSPFYNIVVAQARYVSSTCCLDDLLLASNLTRSFHGGFGNFKDNSS